MSFPRLQSKLCVKVRSQHNDLVHSSSTTCRLSLSPWASINSLLQEANCSTFSRFLHFYCLTQVRSLEPIKTHKAWRAHTDMYAHTLIIKCACSHSHTYRQSTCTQTLHVSRCESWVIERLCRLHTWFSLRPDSVTVWTTQHTAHIILVNMTQPALNYILGPIGAS